MIHPRPCYFEQGGEGRKAHRALSRPKTDYPDILKRSSILKRILLAQQFPFLLYASASVVNQSDKLQAAIS
jgi:hypothetical protein